MAALNLNKRIVYAGDVYTALLKAGFDAVNATLFVESIPDVPNDELVRRKKNMEERQWLK